MPQSNHPTFAAMDLGSNSFHMIVVELVDHKIHVVDRVKESVRLAAGVGPEGELDADAGERALSCLALFGQRVAGIPEGHIRAVGTSALRRIKGNGPESFFALAERTLGLPINIVSGVEEARLIHQGVQSEVDCMERQLIVDIGGSSTELILADKGLPTHLKSTHMGCVVFGKQFKNAAGCYDLAALQLMQRRVVGLLLPHRNDYVKHGWNVAFGASGTVKAIHNVLQGLGLAQGTITAVALDKLYQNVVQISDPEQLTFVGLSDSRKSVFHAGVTILHTIFQQLGIQEMDVATSALREGVIHELMVREGLIDNETDVREATVARVIERYIPNPHQSAAVLQTVDTLIDAFGDAWQVSINDQAFLRWAASLSDIGLSISHSGYHKHGAYLLSHADMAGFSHADQRVLATLVRTQRGSVREEHLAMMPERSRASITPLIVMLRLSLAANRARDKRLRPPWNLIVDSGVPVIKLAADWLAANPLSAGDLLAEVQLAEQLAVPLRLA